MKDRDCYKRLLTFAKDRTGHDRRYAINCDKIKQELSWRQKFDFEEGLMITIKWYMYYQDWVCRVRSGECRKWMERNYKARGNRIIMEAKIKELSELKNKTLKKWPKVGIIILNWNGWKDTIECLESLSQITYPYYKVIVVDNGSKDESIKKIREYCEGKIKVESKFLKYSYENKPIKVIEYERKEAEVGRDKEKEVINLPSNKKLIIIKNEKNYGFAKGNNSGVKYVLKDLEVDYVLILNNDTVVDKRFLTSGVQLMERKKDVGIVTGKIFFYDDPQRIWAAGGHINLFLGTGGGVGSNQLDKGQFKEIKEIDYAPGTMMLIKRSVIEKIGYLPECYFATVEEMEFALEVSKEGYKIIYNPNSIIFHKVGLSSDPSLKYKYNSRRSRLLFIERNFPKPYQRFWVILFIIMCKYHLRFRKKDYKGLDIFNLALRDHKRKKFITEEDLDRAEIFLKEKWR